MLVGAAAAGWRSKVKLQGRLSMPRPVSRVPEPLSAIEVGFDGVVVVFALVREEAVSVGAVGEDAVDVEFGVAVVADFAGDDFVAGLIGGAFLAFEVVAVDGGGNLADQLFHLALGGAVLGGQPLAIEFFRGDGGCGEKGEGADRAARRRTDSNRLHASLQAMANQGSRAGILF